MEAWEWLVGKNNPYLVETAYIVSEPMVYRGFVSPLQSCMYTV
jgi:hypothetical protein